MKCKIAVLIIYLVLLMMVLGVCIYRPIDKASNTEEVIVLVTDKTVKNYNNDSKYLIFTKDTEGNISTYEITDSLLIGRFNSSDVYAGIEIGEIYKFTVGGSRVGFLSWYPNIIDYELILEE